MLSSPFAREKRSRDDYDQECSPEKRSRTRNANDASLDSPSHSFHQPDQLPPHVPTHNVTSTLAQQQQRALEQMSAGAMEREDVEMGMDQDMDGNGSGSDLESNPVHPWSAAVAPRMVYQLSSNSLSASSFASGDSSMPTTPLDLPLNEQGVPAHAFFTSTSSYHGYSALPTPAGSLPSQSKPSPSSHNPTSFTDMNGTTHYFASSSPPAPSFPAPMNTPADLWGEKANPMESAPFPMHAWGAAHAAQGVSGGMSVEQEKKPVAAYGWDVPKQANTLNMGAHLI
ncbi:hypothetical protein JCM8547_002829 [Rhodosporidiobolus lusitaniae]